MVDPTGCNTIVTTQTYDTSKMNSLQSGAAYFINGIVSVSYGVASSLKGVYQYLVDKTPAVSEVSIAPYVDASGTLHKNMSFFDALITETGKDMLESTKRAALSLSSGETTPEINVMGRFKERFANQIMEFVGLNSGFADAALEFSAIDNKITLTERDKAWVRSSSYFKESIPK
jgi:hypothetical protein